MTRKMHSLGSIAILSFLVVVHSTVATQTDRLSLEGKLTYLQYAQTQAGGISTYLQTSAAGTVTFQITADQCATVSEDGQYIAVSGKAPTDLSIYRLSDQTLVRQVVWLEGWQACNFVWREGEDAIYIAGANGVLQINVADGRISPIPSSSAFDNHERLPFKVPGEAVIATDDGRLLLYNQCVDLTFADDGSFCEGEARIVIYDPINRAVIQELSDTNYTILGDFEGFPPKPPAAFWSPSGRTLLYFTTDEQANIPLRIFDVLERRTMDVVLPTQYLANPFFAGFQWSADENHVGFWLNSSDPQDEGRGFYFSRLSLQSESLDVTGQPYSFAQQWRWSPDNSAVAFINRDSQLILLSLADERASLIDENVYSIIAWTP